MDAVALAHAAAAAAYAGFQWTVRAVVYPQLLDAGRASPGTFAAHEARHQQRIARLVGPLFAGLVATTALVVRARPASSLARACGACTAVVLAATALGAVPAHRALERGYRPEAAARLLRWDTVRVVAATVQAVAAVALAAGAPRAGAPAPPRRGSRGSRARPVP